MYLVWGCPGTVEGLCRSQTSCRVITLAAVSADAKRCHTQRPRSLGREGRDGQLAPARSGVRRWPRFVRLRDHAASVRYVDNDAVALPPAALARPATVPTKHFIGLIAGDLNIRGGRSVRAGTVTPHRGQVQRVASHTSSSSPSGLSVPANTGVLRAKQGRCRASRPTRNPFVMTQRP
jgi:hypothetical protein